MEKKKIYPQKLFIPKSTTLTIFLLPPHREPLTDACSWENPPLPYRPFMRCATQLTQHHSVHPPWELPRASETPTADAGHAQLGVVVLSRRQFVGGRSSGNISGKSARKAGTGTCPHERVVQPRLGNKNSEPNLRQFTSSQKFHQFEIIDGRLTSFCHRRRLMNWKGHSVVRDKMKFGDNGVPLKVCHQLS